MLVSIYTYFIQPPEPAFVATNYGPAAFARYAYSMQAGAPAEAALTGEGWWSRGELNP